MRYKLLILDIDGVLVKSKDAPVSDAVVQAVISANQRVAISLCTGRTQTDAQRIIDVLNLRESYHVIESGAKVLNSRGEEENVKSISIEDAHWIIDIAKNTPAGYGYCVNGKWEEDATVIGGRQVTTVSLHSHSQRQTKLILEAITPVSEKYHVAVGSHWQIPEGNFILITHKEATKGSAISYVQERLGITKEETIGVGDMPNDLPIFERSGLKIAVGNADGMLKKKADEVVPSIDEDGVAYVINKYIFDTVGV